MADDPCHNIIMHLCGQAIRILIFVARTKIKFEIFQSTVPTYTCAHTHTHHMYTHTHTHSQSYNHVDCHIHHAGTIKLVLKYSPKVLEEMEFRFENTKSFRRGKAASSRR